MFHPKATKRKPNSESRRYQKDVKGREKHVKKAQVAFKQLLRVLKPIAIETKTSIPGRGPKVIASRARLFNKLVVSNTQLQEYLDTYIGTVSADPQAKVWRKSVINQAKNVLIKGDNVGDVIDTVGTQAESGFQAMELAISQAPLRETLPSELRDFLPKNIVVMVDEVGRISNITDRFGNEHTTLNQKVQRMRTLVGGYNAIAKRVKKDLKSSDEVIQLAALVTGIMMETGIRPGKEGSGYVKTENGEKISIETFGATTLGPSHVKFIRNNFAELEFVGKKGAVNFATLTDNTIIKVLKSFVDKTEGKYIFVTSDGKRLNYGRVQKYLRDRFKNLSPTDFRKIRATEAVLDALREDQASLHERIKQFASLEKEALKASIVKEVVATLSKALESAQKALSHDNSSTTKGAYINPQVILRFLSTAKVEDSLEKVILSNAPLLYFDPQMFLDRALEKKASMFEIEAPPSTNLSLQDILDDIELDLEGFGIQAKSSSSSPDPRRVLNMWLR